MPNRRKWDRAQTQGAAERIRWLTIGAGNAGIYFAPLSLTYVVVPNADNADVPEHWIYVA